MLFWKIQGCKNIKANLLNEIFFHFIHKWSRCIVQTQRGTLKSNEFRNLSKAYVIILNIFTNLCSCFQIATQAYYF